MGKVLRYYGEAAAAGLVFGLFRLLPVSAASALGGWLGRNIGPHLAASRKADKNIAMALPELDAKKRQQIIKGMWDNLGRVCAEYPHLRAVGQRGQLLGQENMHDQGPCIFVMAHLGNWEAAGAIASTHGAIETAAIYRAPNNPWIAGMIARFRRKVSSFTGFAKSARGMREAMRHLKQGQNLTILFDQKYNPGPALPFFGVSAHTSTAAVEMAQKMNVPLYPVRSKRINGVQSQLEIYPALPLYDAQEKPLPAEYVMMTLHHILEDWIKDTPEQWLWLHRRWPRQNQCSLSNTRLKG